jgi:hypothetical protein
MVIAKKPMLELEYLEIEQEIMKMFKKLNLLA